MSDRRKEEHATALRRGGALAGQRELEGAWLLGDLHTVETFEEQEREYNEEIRTYYGFCFTDCGVEMEMSRACSRH
jgi:hypothetical protein